MSPAVVVTFAVPIASCFAGTARLARRVLAQRRARYAARLQAEWQLVLALFEQDPQNDDYMRPVAGRIKAEDMKTLLERRDTAQDAAMAVQMFCYQLRKQIGALTSALGGLDLLVFTGGIGERAAPVRWEACSGLKHLGVKLDRERNDSNADTISTPDYRCLVRVVPTNEDLMIAWHTNELVFS